jgi:uncharacterized protein YaiE (UPF0345 family)
MDFSNEILNELRAISPLLAGIQKTNVFSVPEGYFNMLPDNIFDRVNTNYLFADKQQKKTDLTIPNGYFENLSSSILHKIKSLEDDYADEIKDLSPLLSSLKNQNVFNVPSEYFENLPRIILDKAVTKQAKVITLKKRKFVWKYAVAAAMTGVIGISSLLVYNKGERYEYQAGETYKVALQYKNEQQINDGISKLSDNEIIKYLEKNTTDADNEALNTNIEEKELPAQKDYLLDEKTLDIYLDKIGAKNTNN